MVISPPWESAPTYVVWIQDGHMPGFPPGPGTQLFRFTTVLDAGALRVGAAFYAQHECTREEMERCRLTMEGGYDVVWCSVRAKQMEAERLVWERMAEDAPREHGILQAAVREGSWP